MRTVTKFQIGKNGITDGTIESLELALKNHKQIRISVLKSSGRNRESIHEMAQEIKKRLLVGSDARILGFTIILIRRDKAKDKKRKNS